VSSMHRGRRVDRRWRQHGGVFFSLAIKFPHRARKAARSEQAKAGPPSSGAVSPLQHSKGEKAMQKEIESANPAVERSH